MIAPERISEIYRLHSAGLTDRRIGDAVGVHHNTVAYHRRRAGLKPNGETRGKFEFVGADHARCSRCAQVKPLLDWPVAREGRKYPYRLTYCRDCRRRQITMAQNKTEDRNIRTRWYRLKARCQRLGILCTISLEELSRQWASQKGLCFYTDQPLELRYGHGTLENSFSVDKVDPALGYVDGNVVIAATRINRLKFDVTLDEMKRWMPGWHICGWPFGRGDGARRG